MRHIYILSCESNGGIFHYLFRDGKFEFIEKVQLDRPMYSIIRDKKLYAILREIDTETHFGGVLSFDIDTNGILIHPSRIQNTDGIVPCHLVVVDKKCYVANYLSGNIVKIGEKTVVHNGKGVHPTRQEAPHTHFVCASPNQNYIVCTDLGLDKIFVYDKDLNEKYSVDMPKGSGPRHLCFSNDVKFLYCVNELSNDVSVLEWNNGKPILKNTYSAIPNYHGDSTAAAIRIYNNRIYVSHRGADCISCFEIKNGTLELLWNTPCGGNSPRDFDIVEGYIICTNEGGNVSVLKLFENGAELVSNSIKISNPLCVTIGE